LKKLPYVKGFLSLGFDAFLGVFKRFSMQKKIVALAIAGLFSGAVYAQTNVTLYGAVHTGYVYSKSDFRKFQGIEDGTMGASALGVRGEEALGNGLKAVFNVEWRIRSDTGTLASQGGGDAGTNWTSDARWAFVGLAGNFGTFTAGRVRTPSDDLHGVGSSMGWTGITPLNTLAGAFSNGLLTGDRWNNSIKYVSPNFSGLDFTAVYSFGEKVSKTKAKGICDTSKECADTTDASKLGLGLRYANGPLNLVLIYEAQADDDSQKTSGTNANTGYGAKGWQIGGAYDFNVVKIHATYLRVKANHNGLADGIDNAGSDKQSLWSLGLSAPVSTAGKVWFEYAQYKDYVNYDAAGFTGAKPADTRKFASYHANAGHKTKAYNIGYEHSLSKRTSLHAFVTRFNNDHGINNAYAKTTVEGKNQNVFAMGIRHNF
jgi:predicted porin